MESRFTIKYKREIKGAIKAPLYFMKKLKKYTKRGIDSK